MAALKSLFFLLASIRGLFSFNFRSLWFSVRCVIFYGNPDGLVLYYVVKIWILFKASVLAGPL